MSLLSVLRLLFNKKATLSPLEKEILDCVRNRLDTRAVTKWDAQVRSINKVQRLPDGVEVDFYRMKEGQVTSDPELAFPNRTEELRLATASIRLNSHQVTASIWCVKGFLFSIEFEGSIKYFEEAVAMEPAPKLHIDCHLNADPMSASA